MFCRKEIPVVRSSSRRDDVKLYPPDQYTIFQSGDVFFSSQSWDEVEAAALT